MNANVFPAHINLIENLQKFPIFPCCRIQGVKKINLKWFEIRHHSKLQRCVGISPFFLIFRLEWKINSITQLNSFCFLPVVFALCVSFFLLCIPTCKVKRKQATSPQALDDFECKMNPYMGWGDCATWSLWCCCHINSLSLLSENYWKREKRKENRRKLSVKSAIIEKQRENLMKISR